MSEITVKRSGAKRRSQMSRAQAKAAWGLSAPAIIIMFLFMILPFFMSAFYSFTDRRLVLNPNKPTKFVGWANYIKTFTNKTALQAFWNTFEYTIILVPVVLILATLLALLVNRKAKGVTFFRMIYFSPQVVTMTVVTVIWASSSPARRTACSTRSCACSAFRRRSGFRIRRWRCRPSRSCPSGSASACR